MAIVQSGVHRDWITYGTTVEGGERRRGYLSERERRGENRPKRRLTEGMKRGWEESEKERG